MRRPAGLKPRTVAPPRPLLDHDYCYTAWLLSQQPPQPPGGAPQPAVVNEMSEIEKIVSNVALGGYGDGVGEHNYQSPASATAARDKAGRKERRRKRKKEKKRKKRKQQRGGDSSSDTDEEVDVVGKDVSSTPSSATPSTARVDMFGIQARQSMGQSMVQAHNFLIPGGGALVQDIAPPPPPPAPGSPTKKKRGRPRKTDLGAAAQTPAKAKRRGPKPKYHTPVDVAKAKVGI